MSRLLILLRALACLSFLLPLQAGAQGADAINDMLRGESGTPDVAPLPPVPATPRVATPEGNSWSAPQVGRTAEGHTKITYYGQAAGDGRKARITLIFSGPTVTGTVWIQRVCETNVRLGGADLTLRAQLSGAWESKDARITGDWEGTEHFCGSDVRNHGTMEFFLKDDGYFDPVMHLRIIGERGRYGWNFKPAGRELIEDPSAGAYVFPTDDEDPVVPGAKDDDDPDGAGDKDDKPRLPWRDPIDPDQVTGLELTPGILFLKPGDSRRLPWVIALIGDDSGASDRRVPDENLQWVLPPELEILDGKLKLSAMVKDEKEIPFAVKIRIEEFEDEVQGRVQVKLDEPLGSISGVVVFDFDPSLPAMRGARPRSAVLELIPRGKTPGERQRFRVGPDGRFEFRNLPKGIYWVEARSVVPPDFPQGYSLDKTKTWWSTPITLGLETGLYSKSPPVWDHKTAVVTVFVTRPKPKDGHIWGRVIYRDKGVGGVMVMAHNTADSDIHAETASRPDGSYQLLIDDLPDGEYWIRAEKYLKPRVAGPDDLLDVRTNRLGDAILVHSPLSDPRGVEIDIEVDKRHAIFGGPRETPHIPILPGK
ncbi:carboxypeptidase-like regulatory domain-containing protein [Mameliella alba]|nr:carboxypeptidase-like regulatory domain-containing protein [Mameliella alba]MBY6169724.1 carboxypeptidase-like regulatory domain-containing protein [Mameliella alba]MBY6174743.1 carboxypeptidase-like regulatory domain-containing protein [Mameliella alba]